MPFTIKTLNDDYVLVYMEGWEDMGGNKNISEIDASMLWMQCDGEKGKINLMIDEYSPNTSWGEPESRTGYVLAFSRAEYEDIKDNLEETIVENGEIAYKYEQRNLLIAFIQKEVKEETEDKSFKIKKADGKMLHLVKRPTSLFWNYSKETITLMMFIQYLLMQGNISRFIHYYQKANGVVQPMSLILEMKM